MTEKDKPIPEDDPKQSDAFRKAVRELEAAGELNPEEGEAALRKLLRRTNQQTS
jgi:hypothetical protein